MILFDTNVVIDMINNKNDEHWNLLKQDNIVLCEIVIAELYRGIRNKTEEKAVELFVNSMDCLELNESDWKQIGCFILKLKSEGITVPFQDAVIAYLAIKFNCILCSNDKHFALINTVEKRLKLG